MKTTVMTIALALGSMALMSAQTPAQNPTTPAPAAKTAPVKKHHKKAVKKSSAAAKTAPAAPATAAKPVAK